MSKTAIKICGLSTPETVDAALRAGASHIGLVFFAKSPRNVAIELAARLAAQTHDGAYVVGLFVDPAADLVEQVCSKVRLDAIQLHGSESPAETRRIREHHGLEVWKAISVRRAADVAEADRYFDCADRILYDAKSPPGSDLPGGNGLRFDWTLLSGATQRIPWVLAGGLDPRNVTDAIRTTGAAFVDTSSGVENAPGVKDAGLIADFCAAVRAA